MHIEKNVIERARDPTELMHGPTEVVERLLTVASQLTILIEKRTALNSKEYSHHH